MAESTLALTLVDLAQEVASYLGYGRTASNWTGWNVNAPYVPSNPDTQLGHIMACVQAGLRQFYFPKLVQGENVAYKWSFLVPQRTLQLVTGQATYDLPDDFGGLEGELTYQPSDSTWQTIRRTGPGEVSRLLQQLQAIRDKPQKCAVTPKTSDGAYGQRYQITFAPVPNGNYVLTYYCRLFPQALTIANPYPYGGAAHAETILESCLAVAESRFQDEQTNHRQAFQERLEASIAVDVRDFKPDLLGQNTDRSDYREIGGAPWTNGSPWSSQTGGATFNGVQYLLLLALSGFATLCT